jgi:hypothetical protein
MGTELELDKLNIVISYSEYKSLIDKVIYQADIISKFNSTDKVVFMDELYLKSGDLSGIYFENDAVKEIIHRSIGISNKLIDYINYVDRIHGKPWSGNVQKEDLKDTVESVKKEVSCLNHFLKLCSFIDKMNKYIK